MTADKSFTGEMKNDIESNNPVPPASGSTDATSNFTPASLKLHDEEMKRVAFENPLPPKNIQPFETEAGSNYVKMDDQEIAATTSIVSSVITADGISDFSGFYTVCYIVLLGDMSRGIMFPTLWPLVRSLGGTEVTQGYAVAAFSFGRILVSPMFGSWSIKYGYRYTLLVSSTILLIGTILYSQASHVGRPEFLIFAQTILGIGSGTLGVTRAYVAEITPTRNRTTYMAYLTALQYAGFTVTPFFGALFSAILNDADEEGFETG